MSTKSKVNKYKGNNFNNSIIICELCMIYTSYAYR